ncbi:LacI family DNA-binding transcriptional regulator [Humibacter sp. RRB41]|uniref:LacI family DNA-binding transcriptional regulator n=1 Tax=Humibacter sp. RRB41 TaxID=2919946 RepID=UPI001FAA0986|nr:LacI family DNA-binding transcriptional regulator [Humibacter sp. RRB41]
MPTTDTPRGTRQGGSRGPARVGSANLRDVAARAGVSPATASRVFGGSSSVHADTRAKVLAAADELGYVVNGLARAMTGRGPGTVAFVVRSMIGPTFASLAAGAESVATANGHLLLISTTEGDRQRESDLIATLREQRTRAVLYVGSTESNAEFDARVSGYAKDLADVDASLVLCGRPPVATAPGIVSVDYDHRAGVGTGVDELVRLGHTRIGYLGEGKGMTTAELRIDGYRAAMKRNHLPHPTNLVHDAANNEDAGEAAARELLSLPIRPTAIVAMTDNIAVGTYRAARSLGLRIPEDLSIVGFDDVPIVGDLTPGLTTVHPPFFEVGVRAARIALGLEPAENVLLQPSFVRRGSTTSPAQA